jgi:hypothetical protein
MCVGQSPVVDFGERAKLGGMNLDISARWADLWSSRWQDGACRVRFELGGEDFTSRHQPIPRALRAFTRARTVADALFGEACIGVVATDSTPYRRRLFHWPRGEGAESIQFADGFAALQAMGFLAKEQSSWCATVHENEDDGTWTMRSFDLTESVENRDTLLWNAITSEMPIWPSSTDLSFLLHPTKGILLYVYDDRGMDVIGSRPELLRPIYERFDRWLLDSDRTRMAQVFATK